MSNRTYFKYYWEGLNENGSPVAIYGHKYQLGAPAHSDASIDTLQKEGVEIPATPSYEYWLQEVNAGRRCRRCYHAIRSPYEREHHNSDCCQTKREGKLMKTVITAAVMALS